MTKSLNMTPARRITLALGVPVALIAIGGAGYTAVGWAGRASYPVHFSIPVRGAHVSISVGDGKVSVRPGSDSRVTGSGTVHYSLTRPKLSLRSTGSGVAVGTSCRSFAVSCSLDVAVAVPAGLGTDISLGSGDLSASGLSGPVTLSAQSGDIIASALSGPDTRLAAESGDIKVTSLTSQVVTASDQSGNITLYFTAVPQRVVITGESGDITLVLPRGPTAYRVTARTSSGSTTIRVPTSPDSSHVITATTASGNVTIIR